MEEQSATGALPVSERPQYPLTPMQQGMLFHARAQPDSGVDIEQIRMRFRARADVAALTAAWQWVVDRHVILRTQFLWEGLAEPLQQVAPAVTAAVERIDAADAEHFADQDRSRGFDLSEPGAMRLALLDDAGTHVLLWTFHHILLDGRSFPIVLAEVMQAYDALVAGEQPPETAAPPPFEQFARWHHAQDWADSRAFWHERLDDFAAPTPLPWSPAAEQPAADRAGVAHQQLRLSAEQTAGLEAVVASADMGWSALLEAAWAVLLWRHSNETDVTFGITRAGRRGTVADSEDMVGLFINTVPMRVQLDPDASFIDLATAVRATQQDIRAHQHLGLAAIQREAAGSPRTLFESLVLYDHQVLDDAMSARQPADQAFAACDFHYRGRTGYPLTLLAYGGEQLLLELEFDRARFTPDTADALLARLALLLGSLAEDPTQPAHMLDWVTPGDTEHVLTGFNQTAQDWPEPPRSVAEAVLDRAQQQPDALAVIADGVRTSYAALTTDVDRLAAVLVRAGVKPGDRVAVATGRSAGLIVAMLAAHRAGAAYVPCDPRYPDERLQMMLEDAGAAAVVTDQTALDDLPPTDAPIVNLDDLPSAEAQEPVVFPDPDNTRTAFVIFTSGSTGRPKGVMISQANVLNYLRSTARILDARAGERMLAVTTLSFDIAVLELFMPLLTGGVVVMASADDALDGRRIAGLIDEHAVDRMQATPVSYRLLLAAGWQPPADFVAITGGEALDPALARDVRAAGANLTLWNIYGPTETTVWSTCDRVDDGPIAIGKPLHNTRCYVVDAWDSLVPPGVAGELLIGGDGVSQGYLGRPDLTEQRFVSLAHESDGQVYRSGDRVYWRHDGRLAYLERMDFQVKLRGFRIELGEIEAVLTEHPAVSQTVCVLDRDGGDRLVAYAVISGTAEPAALQAWLRERLPAHMVPAIVMTLDAMPLTPNGKVNRRGLPPPVLQQTSTGGDAAPPRTATEQAVSAIWADVLGVDAPGRDEAFFEIGGDSLRLVEVLGRLQSELDAQLSVADLFRFTTIAQIAQHLDASRNTGADAAAATALDDRAAKRRAALASRRAGGRPTR